MKVPYKIKNVSVQGIRGFNKPEKLTFGEGVTLLYGENGTGKSSLLQSIEWAITGSVPSMKGGDFSREDAIVNLFNKSKKAIVELNLSNEGDSLAVSRTRKMSTRTASGKQPLEMTLGSKTFKDEEAETELQSALGIDLEDFSQTKYLHQETIREILNAKPEERSQAIDKLIGTFEIREFAKAIDVDRRIKSSVAVVQETLESLRRDKIQFLLNLKRSLEKTKETLLKKGYTLQDLSLPTALKKINQAQDEVGVLHSKYGTKTNKLEIESDVSSLVEAQRVLLSQLNSLDRVRLEAINKINMQKTTMTSNATRYEDIYNQLKGMKETNAATLAERIKQIDKEITKINGSVKEIRQKLVALPRKRSIYEDNKARVAAEKGKLEEIIANQGTVEEIKQKIEKAQEELATFQNDFDKLSSQQGLLTMAIDNLEATKNQECPVCSQSINNEELVKALRLKVSEDIVARIKKLKESQKTVKANERILGEKLEESNHLLNMVSELERTLATSAEQLRTIVPNFDLVSLDDLMEDWEKQIRSLSEKEAELKSEQNSLSDVLTRLSKLSSDVKRLEAELQKATSSTTEGPDLLKKVEELNKTLDEKITDYSNSSDVDKLRKTLSDLADVLNYLGDNSKVAAAEEELPTVEAQLRGLETRRKQLEGLSNSLQSIRQIAIQYEKEAAVAQLKRLEDDINNYYSKIQGHPYFKRIKIDVEKEDPLIFSIRAAGALEDTYIPTRFSTAQLNAVALSIFMSYNNEQTGNLPIMILDDPTQNMDLPHKETFAKLIATLSSQNQIIIATEDTDTRRLLEKQCPGIMTYEFGNWTNEGTKISAA